MQNSNVKFRVKKYWILIINSLFSLFCKILDKYNGFCLNVDEFSISKKGDQIISKIWQAFIDIKYLNWTNTKLKKKN